MPVMDGLTATQQIRKGKNQADINIIGLTAKARKEDRDTCLDAGMNHYLAKLTKSCELICALENVETIVLDTTKDSHHAISYHILDLE